MIQQQSILKVIDNSGAKTVKCLKVLSSSKMQKSLSGTLLIVVIKQLKTKLKTIPKVKKGQLYKALVIQSKSKFKKANGMVFLFNKNLVVLLNKQNNLIGSRLFGTIPKSLKLLKNIKFMALSTGFF